MTPKVEPLPSAVLALLSFVFFLSGVSALIFETLWFRQAGLTFGNSVWASALVLSSFMAGLALGNGLAARYGHRIRHPIRFYAVLEVAIAGAGLALVWFLPRSTPLFASLLRPLLDTPWLIHPARFAAAFALLLIPAVAMGATLPTLIKAVAGGRDFGERLGRLYGWNTLGAVVGAVTSEVVWMPRLGVMGSGVVAASGNLLAAALAMALALRVARSGAVAEADPERGGRPTWAAARLLIASFASGGILLALEVVWFRMMSLFAPNTSEAFAWMLATVLAGIGVGGLLASLWLRARPSAHGGVSALALLSAVACVGCYALLPWLRGHWPDARMLSLPAVVTLSAGLMLAVSLLSGVLFVFLGKRLHDRLGSGVRAAGLVTFANTLGAMLGPLVAGFVLLPRLGMERSIFLLAACYAGVALCAVDLRAFAPAGARLALNAGAVAAFVASLVYFPFGASHGMYRAFLEQQFPREQLVEYREGVISTLVYLRADWQGSPYHYRLVTDNYSMSATTPKEQRYMQLFVHLPVAFHRQPRQALLISYGLGTTASALVESPELEHVDVVDISPEILAMSELVFPPGLDPLDDPRVEVHVEDGRYFLQTTQRRYDLITGEPPPPALAGVVNLYTREYFQLIHSRLAEGGLVSYWLPVVQMSPPEAQAIIRAFCDAFPDCSLWEGTPFDWILLGTRDATGPLPESIVRGPWRNPKSAASLRAIGVERAEQLAALFLADASFLVPWTRDVPPLVDDHPHRAPRHHTWRTPPREFSDLMYLDNARRRFESSEFIARMWPESLRESSLAYFDYQRMARESILVQATRPIGVLHQVLARTSLETLPLWLLDSDAGKQAILEELDPDALRSGDAAWHHALGALASRNYELAAERLARISSSEFPLRDYYRLYALGMAGRVEQAREEARTISFSGSAPPYYWRFMKATFGISDPSGRDGLGGV